MLSISVNIPNLKRSLCGGPFLLNSKISRATKGNKENVALLKKAGCHVSSEKFKKVYEVLEGLRHSR
jgi:hypothetical protein